MEVLWLKSRGLDHAQIAELAGVSGRTVQRYLNEYQQGGLERIKQDRYVGPTSALERHAVSLREYFEKHPPASVKEAQHVIEQQTGIRREESQVRAFLHRLGMRCRQVGTVPGKLTEEQQAEQRRFLEEELSPKLDEAEAGQRKFFCGCQPFRAWGVRLLPMVFRAAVRKVAVRTETLERAGRGRLRDETTGDCHEHHVHHGHDGL
jgi:transposase